jgi:hypothetical protein
MNEYLLGVAGLPAWFIVFTIRPAGANPLPVPLRQCCQRDGEGAVEAACTFITFRQLDATLDSQHDCPL